MKAGNANSRRNHVQPAQVFESDVFLSRYVDLSDDFAER